MTGTNAKNVTGNRPYKAGLRAHQEGIPLLSLLGMLGAYGCRARVATRQLPVPDPEDNPSISG